MMMDIIGIIFDIAFVFILSFSLMSVNKQLALFFNQIGIRSYPKKSIIFLITAFFFISVLHDVFFVLKEYMQIANTYHSLEDLLNMVVLRAVNLTITLAFYFLADFGFEARIDRGRTETNIQGRTETNIQVMDANINNTTWISDSATA